MKKNILLLPMILLCGFCLVACVNLGNKYVTQQKYALTVNQPNLIIQKNNKIQSNKILEIYYPEIAAQFSSANFSYRTHELKYINDFYNMFITLPTEQIYQNELKYLSTTKLFKHTSGNVEPLQPDYILKTYINELYADYQDRNSPKAVMSIQFTLLDTHAKPAKIILQKTFSKSELLSQKTSEALVAAWSKELESSLQQLAGVMQKTTAATNK